LGIILWIAAATSDINILITTVIATSIAESISMGAGTYTSALSQKDFYHSEREKEKKEIKEVPEMERVEVRRIYEAKGLKGKVLEEVIKTITANKTIWINTMMADELHIEPDNTEADLKSSVIVTIATFIGYLIPLFLFFFVAHLPEIIIALILSAITLFAVGVYLAVTLVRSWWKSGLRMLLIGLGAATGYLIVRLFHATNG